MKRLQRSKRSRTRGVEQHLNVVHHLRGLQYIQRDVLGETEEQDVSIQLVDAFDKGGYLYAQREEGEIRRRKRRGTNKT